MLAASEFLAMAFKKVQLKGGVGDEREREREPRVVRHVIDSVTSDGVAAFCSFFYTIHLVTHSSLTYLFLLRTPPSLLTPMSYVWIKAATK